KVTDISEDLKGIDALITSEPYAVLDNADRKIKGLEDKLALSATGGSIKRRDLYTTNRLVKFPIIAALGITSRTPHFRREDVADRILPIHVERFDTFLSAGHVKEQIDQHRDSLMTLIMHKLQCIVALLHAQRREHIPSRFRLADFAEFSLKVGPAFGFARHEVEEGLDQLAWVQVQFTIENEPLLEVSTDGWKARPTSDCGVRPVIRSMTSNSQRYKGVRSASASMEPSPSV